MFSYCQRDTGDTHERLKLFSKKMKNRARETGMGVMVSGLWAQSGTPMSLTSNQFE